MASCALAGILGWARGCQGLLSPDCGHGCAAPGRKNARWPLEIRMFLWLNCFVASIECVPGLALNSCTGLEGSSSSAQAAGTGIMLILLGSKPVPRRQPCCPAATSPARVAPGGSPGCSGGGFGAHGGWEGVSPPRLGCSALCASFSCSRSDFRGCAAAPVPPSDPAESCAGWDLALLFPPVSPSVCDRSRV